MPERVTLEEGRRLMAKAQGTQPEAVIKKQIRQYLEVLGWFVRRIQQSALSEPGLPDLFAMKDGRLVFIEVKTRTGRLSEHQKAFEAKCREHGVEHIVARSLADVTGMERGKG